MAGSKAKEQWFVICGEGTKICECVISVLTVTPLSRHDYSHLTEKRWEGSQQGWAISPAYAVSEQLLLHTGWSLGFAPFPHYVSSLLSQQRIKNLGNMGSDFISWCSSSLL